MLILLVIVAILLKIIVKKYLVLHKHGILVIDML